MGDNRRCISSARCGRRTGLHAAIIVSVLVVPQVCFAQAKNAGDQTKPAVTERTPKNANDDPPLTDRERALLELIRDLQERVARLESQAARHMPGAGPDDPAQSSAVPSVIHNQNSVATVSSSQVSTTKVAGAQKPAILNLPPPTMNDLASAKKGAVPAIRPDATEPPLPAAAVANANEQSKVRDLFGTYTPNLGFKVADTEHGDMNISIYTYVRYLNQLGLAPTYTDAFGNTKNVQQRQDFQIQKVQMKFLGWVLSEKFRYFLYAWTSNANQGLGAQVVLAGNLNYTFNKYITLSTGIRSLPGTRSVEGNFPFWLSVDSRMIADEFFRPSYTSGIWATGEITDRLRYQVMLGNNMSTLGVSAAQLDNGLNTFSSALVWEPTGEFSEGFSGQGWGDFEDHDKLATRLAAHFNRSDEHKESQPNSEQFENTQLRLSDGSIIFTPDLFGKGITIDDATWKMISFDGGLKYHGYALEGEYYLRWLNNFRGTGTEGLKSIFDHGFQLQGSAMVVPKTLQAYVGHSRVFGQYGNPWDFRFGVNWFPFKNKVIRWNTEGLYLYKSPVGYTSVPFTVGGRGMVFHTNLELAF
jgi:hypothetical protein